MQPPVKTLYDWQRACLSRWMDAGCRGIAHVATGAGKTVLALAAIRRLEAHLLEAARGTAHPESPSASAEASAPYLRVRIVVPRVFLAAQWRDALMREASVPRGEIGLYHGTARDDPSHRYMIYVLNSARYRISRHILSDLDAGFSVLLICDECHHFASRENSKVFDFVPHLGGRAADYFSLGLSATPGDDAALAVLAPALGRVIYRYDLPDAVAAKVVSEYVTVSIAVPFTADERETYEEFNLKIFKMAKALRQKIPRLRGISYPEFIRSLHGLCESKDLKIAELAQNLLIALFMRKEVVHNAAMRLDCVCELVEGLIDAHKILVFAERIETLEALYVRLNAAHPGRVGKYHSGMAAAARQNALLCYERSETNVLLCCRALDEGLNIPDTSVGILMSSTSSARQRIQRVGRILRRSESAREKYIYYLYVPESSESPEPLVDAAIDAELRYDPLYGGMIGEEYLSLCDRATQRLYGRDLPPEMADELARNLRLGAVRLDYRKSTQVCMERIQAAQTRGERNYWIAMHCLASAREETQNEKTREGLNAAQTQNPWRKTETEWPPNEKREDDPLEL